jgi:hypothetical protein
VNQVHVVLLGATGEDALRRIPIGARHATDPDQQIIVWTAEAGTRSHDGLRLLASWVADQPHLAASTVH